MKDHYHSNNIFQSGNDRDKWMSQEDLKKNRSVFANDKFVKLMQDVTRDKAEKDIWEVRLCYSQYIP